MKLEQKSNGDIILEIGNAGNSTTTQNLKLYRNGVLQSVITVDQLETAINGILGITTEIVLADTSVLTFVNGVLTSYEQAN